MMIRLAIVEDHPAIADGLAALIHGSPDFTVVGTAQDTPTASALIERTRPDIVICDIRLSGQGDGFDLVRRHTPGPAFIMLSAYTYPGYQVRALELGVRGYLSKMATADQLLAAIRKVAAGGAAFPATVGLAVRSALPPPTAREMQILGLVAEGHSNVEIARSLSIRVKTVESQLRRLFDRYDVTNRTALARLAERQGWIDVGT